MKSKSLLLSRSYQAALSRYIKKGTSASLQPARRLGRQAVESGLETLDLALIHEQALISHVLSIDTPAVRHRIIKRGRTFFAETILPLEETHRAAIEAVDHLCRLNRSLNQRTLDLANSNGKLKKEITQRLVVEETLRKSEHRSDMLLDQSRRQQKQLKLLSRRILSVQEEERKKISRELHDVIAQMLTGINLRLAVLKVEAVTNIKGIGRKISQTQRLVEKSVNVVHRFARELRPAVLDDLGLVPALHSYMKKFSKETGILVKLTAFADVERVNSVVRTILYRVAHEALTNVARHAKASLVDVTFQKLPKAISMDISDNGKGFDPDRTPIGVRGRRLGLLGIRERVETVGGTFTITSAIGKGTIIHIQIPYTIVSKEPTHS